MHTPLSLLPSLLSFTECVPASCCRGRRGREGGEGELGVEGGGRGVLGSKGGEQPCQEVLVEDLYIVLLQTTPAGRGGQGSRSGGI